MTFFSSYKRILEKGNANGKRWRASTSGGYSLVETIVYMALFVILSTVLVGTLFSMTKTYKDARATNEIVDSSSLSLERMTREIRNATDIDMTTSSFGSNPGTLKLDTTADDGTPKTIQFDVTGDGALELTDSTDGTPTDLTGSEVQVTNLVFRTITTAHSQAVRIEITLASLRIPTKTATFTDTAVLRGSY